MDWGGPDAGDRGRDVVVVEWSRTRTEIIVDMRTVGRSRVFARVVDVLRRPSPRTDPRDRARALAAMYGIGAVIGLLALPFLRDRPADLPALALLCVAAFPVCWLLLRVGSRCPPWLLHLLLGGGTAIVVLATWFGGPGTTGVVYGTILVWVALYAGYFFAPLTTLAHGAVALGGYATSLTLLGGSVVFELVWMAGTTGVVATVSHWLAHGRTLAEVDALTGVANRRGTSAAMAAAMGAAELRGGPLWVTLLDLDRFKRTNDRFGHAAGDALLRTCVDRWRDVLPSEAVLGRYGGDEFVVLLPGHSLHQARATIDRLRWAAPFGQTCSAGVAPWLPGDSESMVLARADTALYQAKREGRDRTSVLAEASDHAAEIWRALADDEFVVHYQPIVDVGAGTEVAVEALVRWQHPEEGLLGPGEFLQAAETSGAVHALGRWVLDEACGQLWAWRNGGPHPESSVSVNLSPSQLLHPRLLGDVRYALDRWQVPPERLMLEVTEDALHGDLDTVAELLRELRALGVVIAIDDFGTGHSSLSRLRSLPFDVIKIDRSFVSGIDRDAGAQRLVDAIVAMADGLGLTTVAEGVERVEELARLRVSGCSLAQGYLFGAPSPAGPTAGLASGSARCATHPVAGYRSARTS